MKNGSETPRVTVICGHYGAGKTTLAVSLALTAREKTEPVYLADADIVNPYFRAADAEDEMRAAGVVPLIPSFANSNVDIPALPPMLSSLLEGNGKGEIFIDVGGDDGAVVLGRYSEAIVRAGYRMLFTVNKYRPLIADPADAAEVMRGIERSARLSCTGVVNCSSLGEETKAEDILSSVDYARDVGRAVGLPVVGHAYAPYIVGDLSVDPRFSGLTLIPVRRTVKKLF